jgi:16S rRNA (cytosine967-C5)-methyltransferase
MSDPAGTAARRGALQLLIAVLWQGRPLETAFDRALAGLDRPADRAFARAIASTVLRRLPDLDALIDGATQRPLPHDARARMVLRLALAQALAMGTPHHAAVSTALPLVDKGPRRLVHGVLSNLLKRGATLPEAPALPEPWATHWAAAYGDLAPFSAALAEEPPTDLILRDPADAAALAPDLDATEPMPGVLRTAKKGALPDWPGFAEGRWWVQDLAASLPARLLGDVRGKAVADLCAAPGGKTLQLAAMGARVTAIDIAETRLARLRENLARTGLAAETVAADARRWAPAAPLDAILLDAPCSASGIFRRHPDVLHLKGARDLAPLVALQAELLDHALGLLPRGGRLIYCTCSLEPEEGEAQIRAALARFANIALDPIRAEELPMGLSPAPGGWLRTLPPAMDGFFIARLTRA